MCCYASRKAKAELLERFGNHKTIRLWKEVRKGGGAVIADYGYSPGVHKLSKPLKKYRLDNPKGFHVHTRRPGQFNKYDEDNAIVSVICNKDNLVRASEFEAVFTQITILKKDWDEAFSTKTEEHE